MKNIFIIVNYNDFKSTNHLINNIKDYIYLDEIIVVDNKSNEKERELLSSLESKKTHIIYNDDNLGYSGAINVGAKYVGDCYDDANLIISNSDIVIMSEEDLTKLINELDKKNVGLVCPQILENAKILRGKRDISINHDILSNIPIIRNFIKNNTYYTNDYYSKSISKVDIVSSCFFLVRLSNLKKINYLDEQIFLYYEDYILSNKIKNIGLDNIIVNDVKIKHLYSISVDKNFNNKDKILIYNNSQLYYHTTYHNINRLQIFLLKLTGKFNLIINKKN